jgi:hypothetical protein
VQERPARFLPGVDAALNATSRGETRVLGGLWALGTRNDEGAVLVVYGRNWPSVPVPSITTNTRFGASARHALLAVVSNVVP